MGGQLSSQNFRRISRVFQSRFVKGYVRLSWILVSVVFFLQDKEYKYRVFA